MDIVLLVSKIISIILIAGISIVGAIVPIVLTKYKLHTAIVLSNAFAAGAFLSLGMFHLLPEAVDEISGTELLISIGNAKYNPVYIFTFLGYVLILFFEAVISNEEVKTDIVDKSTTPVFKNEQNTNSFSKITEGEDEQKERTQHELSVEMGSLAIEEGKNREEKNVCKQKNTFVCNFFSSSGFFLLIALFFHGIFEGIFIGTAATMWSVWLITLVIMGHKWAESFALMMKFITLSYPYSTKMLLMSIFIAATPIGILVGMAASEANGVSGICNGIGAGTVIYVATQLSMEVFADWKELRWIKFFIFLVGASVVFGLTILQDYIESM